MNKIGIAISSGFVLLSQHVFADTLETIQIGRNHCAYEGSQQITPGALRLFSSDSEAQQVANRILRLQGMSLDNANFVLKAAIGNRIRNAAAVVQNQKRYLLYKQSFIQDANRRAGTGWAGISIMAHEIAHHMHGHTLILGGSRPEDELYADRWSGFVLYKLGASRDEATAAVKTIAPERETPTHPGRAERIDAIIHGWTTARELERGGRSSGTPAPRPFVREAVTTTPSSSGVNHSHNGRSHSHPLPAEGLNHQHNGVQSAKPVARPAPAPIAPQVQYKEPEMISIRGGTFMMGSPAREKRRNHNEKQHSVAVANFSIGKYEVSNEEYSRCVTDGACEPPAWQEKGSNYNIQTGGSKHYLGFNGANQPVVGVSWNDAVDYASWLSKKTGKKYSLPTEAQWEYAARAGSANAYPWGKSIGSGRANCKDCGSTSGKKTTTPVKSYSPNAWGLHNTVGNVWEWVCSVYDSAYDGGEQQCTSTSDAYNRVLRGGAWSVGSDLSRSAYRGYKRHSFTFNDIGFRLSRNP